MHTDIITAVLHFERGEQVFKHSEGSDLYPLSSFLNVLGSFLRSLSLSLWLCSKMWAALLSTAYIGSSITEMEPYK